MLRAMGMFIMAGAVRHIMININHMRAMVNIKCIIRMRCIKFSSMRFNIHIV